MGHPAEAHMAVQHDQETAARKKRLQRQHDGLYEILRGPGFGPTDSDALWEEKQIKQHLEAAYRLTELAMR